MKKLLKVLLIIIILLVVVVLVGALFMPNKIQFESSIIIKAKAEVIFEYVNCLEKTKTWSPWEGVEEQKYSGPACGVGAIQEWKDKTGSGKMEIVESKEFEYVKSFLDFGKKETADAELILEVVEDGTKVTWSFNSDAGYPIGRWIGALVVKPMLTDVYNKGLSNLDSVILNLPLSIEVYDKPTVIEVQSKTMLSIREVVTTENIGPKMGEFYGQIYKYIGENQLKPTGYPISLWHTWSDTDSDMECAVLIEGEVEGNDLIKSSKSYEGKAAVLDYYGAYDCSPDGWQKLFEFIKENGLEENGVPWDEYITDPTQETDTAKWLTKLYQPVK